MKGSISAKRLFAATVYTVMAAFTLSASAPAGYYNSLEGLSGTSLKDAVKAIGKKGHKAISYGDDTWKAFRSTDVRKVNGQDCWWDMYSTNNVPVSSGTPGMNIEHSVAKSWWGRTKNNAYKDIVHLNPSNSDANSRKSNFPLGIADPSYSKYWNNGATIVSSPMPGYGGGNNMVYEPCDEYKGDFARVFMYMFTIYDDISWTSNCAWMYNATNPVTFKKWAIDMLLQWSANDPVSDKERYRNDGINKEQGNRNPFIDLPDLADYIWGARKGEAYHLDGSHDPDPVDPDPDKPDPDVPDPDQPKPDVTEGTYLKVTAQSDIKDGARYVIVANIENPVALSTDLNGKFFTPTSEVTVTDNVISVLPDDAAIIKLESLSGSYLLHMEDIYGKSKGYIHSSTTKTMTLSQTPPSSGCSLTVSAEGTAIKFGENGKTGSLEYNVSAPRFTTYTSNQAAVNLFRYIPRSSSVTDIEADNDDSFLVEVWGNNIFAPEGARIFDLNGREVDGANLEKGIYIVVKPSFKKAVKIRI